MSDKPKKSKKPKIPGVVKGLTVPFRTMMEPAVTIQYPHEKEEVAPRARGVIALSEENCTACMLCSRSCPDWCIYIEGHKTKAPPRREGGKERNVNILDRFDIDYSLCMYCGICVEVCPFDALFWSPEFEYSEFRIANLLHQKQTLFDWMDTIPEPEPLEAGAIPAKVKKKNDSTECNFCSLKHCCLCRWLCSCTYTKYCPCCIIFSSCFGCDSWNIFIDCCRIFGLGPDTYLHRCSNGTFAIRHNVNSLTYGR